MGHYADSCEFVERSADALDARDFDRVYLGGLSLEFDGDRLMEIVAAEILTGQRQQFRIL